MLGIAPVLRRWHTAGTPFGLATVVGVRGSAPRRPGAALAVSPGGRVVGSVSGGCVEAEVYELARAAALGAGPRLAEYGVENAEDGDAFAAGLTCGGTLQVLVRQVVPEREPGWGPVLAALERSGGPDGPLAHVTCVGGTPGLGTWLAVRPGGFAGTLGGAALDRAAAARAREMLDRGYTGRAAVRAGAAAAEVFVQSFLARPRMLIFGAVEFARALAGAGRFLGYHVTVCDARPAFTTPERFPEADEVVREWPHRYLAGTARDARTVICVLTHEARFDVPLLREALRLPVAYVGAMGSRRTHEDRLRRLREAGAGEEELARLRSPIGLDLGGPTPEEAAVSIAAELIAVRNGGTGLPLRDVRGPLHKDHGPAGEDHGPAAPTTVPEPVAAGAPPTGGDPP
ncbi:XdhC family protein [Streptomyces roseoverticillatus]|uniref:XdhC family protein n=1 Tax=Streptomyces roseoverticillatus TaxID=66429 RepID=UPI001F19ED11|nr:XdhC/CoxI family protein [Streptomyces roseoverticillatus]MCF3101899.1 XdhC family protein [Streptomyces roseoverticillatus]